MKKGISLIVLVITILVMIILAGAVIITLTNQNIIGKAKWAEVSASRANLQYDAQLAYADYVASNDGIDTGFTYTLPTGSTGLFNLTNDFKTVIYTGAPVNGAPASADQPAWYLPHN